MSWGERSCIRRSGSKLCRYNPQMHTCNVDCIGYVWDKKTKPDSFLKKELLMKKDSITDAGPVKLITCPEDLGLTKSKLPGFSKKHEIVVLKSHLFKIQSVTPKKIILKLFSKGAHPILTDGVYHTMEAGEKNNGG